MPSDTTETQSGTCSHMQTHTQTYSHTDTLRHPQLYSATHLGALKHAHTHVCCFASHVHPCRVGDARHDDLPGPERRYPPPSPSHLHTRLTHTYAHTTHTSTRSLRRPLQILSLNVVNVSSNVANVANKQKNRRPSQDALGSSGLNHQLVYTIRSLRRSLRRALCGSERRWGRQAGTEARWEFVGPSFGRFIMHALI